MQTGISAQTPISQQYKKTPENTRQRVGPIPMSIDLPTPDELAVDHQRMSTS